MIIAMDASWWTRVTEAIKEIDFGSPPRLAPGVFITALGTIVRLVVGAREDVCAWCGWAAYDGSASTARVVVDLARRRSDCSHRAERHKRSML